MTNVAGSAPLRNLFAGLTEHAFLAELGVADTELIAYLAELLARFVHRDAIFAVKGPGDQQIEELAAMLFEAERPENKGAKRRDIFRHVGDFALFWIGVFPEAIRRQRRRQSADALLDYAQQGKRSYYLASTYTDTPDQAHEAPVLRRLSDEFDLCAVGLRRVRSEWEHVGLSAS